MRIGLVDVDKTDKSTWRNLHLMKRAAYHKSIGDEVIFPYDGGKRVDKVFMSVVFTSNRHEVEKWLKLLGDTPVEIGGTGWDLHLKAPPEVEAAPPDYSIYNSTLGPAKYRQGRTSEGCPRACPFCVVPELYGRHIRPVSTLAEIATDGEKRLRLMDDNFWAPQYEPDPDTAGKTRLRPVQSWRERMHEALDGGYRLSFTQGLDIRFVDEERAELLGRLWQAKGVWDEDFASRDVTFAFDSPRIEAIYRKGFSLLTAAGIPPKHIKSFVLTGFDTPPEEDMQRLALLREFGALPFVMVYQPVHGEDMPTFYRDCGWTTEQYARHLQRCKHLQRYANRTALWKSEPNFEHYTRWINQQRQWAKEDRQRVNQGRLLAD